MSLPNELRGNGGRRRRYEKVLRTPFLLTFFVETSRRMFRRADVWRLEYSRVVNFVVRRVPMMSMVTGIEMSKMRSVMRGRMTGRLVVGRGMVRRLGSWMACTRGVLLWSGMSVSGRLLRMGVRVVMVPRHVPYIPQRRGRLEIASAGGQSSWGRFLCRIPSQHWW